VREPRDPVVSKRIEPCLAAQAPAVGHHSLL
jgi:hypothetical protein